ncbi:MAG: amino acid decarboxylase [Clostridia bacterium]|nr:amino acid decarboxylase [Clostridia bacterium]
MTTPIADFVRAYAASGTLRAHMPGHKGEALLGPEPLDITEIHGADSLYEEGGVISESERNAASLFGSRHTLYATEGSSQAIRAMLLLALKKGWRQGKAPVLLCARNAHRALFSAAALLDVSLRFLPSAQASYLSGQVDLSSVEKALSGQAEPPFAVYLTTPDYLGGMADVGGISKVCQRYGVPLLVDNAHGAYLKFLPESQHPMDLGAALCADSAHKTLPVLTGGAYLHIGAPGFTARDGKDALLQFGSTSPSWLTLASLDLANAELANGYPARLAKFTDEVAALRQTLTSLGWALYGEEPLKLTIRAKRAGYTGDELADHLRQSRIECEFSDPDDLTLMLTPETGEVGLRRIREAILSLPIRAPLQEGPGIPLPPEQRVMTPRQALFAPAETVAAEAAVGRVLAELSVGCPPAVPIVTAGEIVTPEAAALFRYYGVERVRVVQES